MTADGRPHHHCTRVASRVTWGPHDQAPPTELLRQQKLTVPQPWVLEARGGVPAGPSVEGGLCCGPLSWPLSSAPAFARRLRGGGGRGWGRAELLPRLGLPLPEDDSPVQVRVPLHQDELLLTNYVCNDLFPAKATVRAPGG